MTARDSRCQHDLVGRLRMPAEACSDQRQGSMSPAVPQTAPAPARVAHRAGNSRLALRRAIEACVDWVEVDIWWHHGKVVARHEPAVWRLPFVYDKWRPRLLLNPVTLAELLGATESGPKLLLDFKGVSRRLPRAAVELLRHFGAVDRAAICGQDWQALDAARLLEPSLRVLYSLDSPRQLTALQKRPAHQPPIEAVSAGHWLLTPEAMAAFHQQKVAVFAWTVNDPARAQTLAALGAAGITSDRLDLLAGLHAMP